MISYLGAPTWFVTFAPADIKHPICLYFADDKTYFSPELRTSNECYRLIAHNPVAGARFFHFMVQLFIKHVLGVDSGHDGLFGKTTGYYGTVEQQGRLTLHLHILIWIANVLSLQEIREKIMDENSEFQKKLVEYLESLCVGEFMTGSKSDVAEKVAEKKQIKIIKILHGRYLKLQSQCVQICVKKKIVFHVVGIHCGGKSLKIVLMTFY
jgi:hypothetical protein